MAGRRGRRRGNGEGTIYQRADGRWSAQVTLPDGQRKTLYGRTRQEVQRELTAIRRSLDLGMPVRRDERMPLSELKAYDIRVDQDGCGTDGMFTVGTHDTLATPLDRAVLEDPRRVASTRQRYSMPLVRRQGSLTGFDDRTV